VTDIGTIEDRSFNQATWEGVAAAKERLGAHVEFLNSKDSIAYMTNIAKFAEAHYDVIITVGFALAPATTDAAKRYPDIKFIGVDQYQVEILPNLAGVVFLEDQAGFLVGALAGMVTKTGKVGAVLGADTVPAVWRFGEGFRAGVNYANPEVKAFIVYHNDVDMTASFMDPDWGATTAQALIVKGADVIFGAGGKTGTGAIISAAKQGVYVIGVDTDQYFTVPEVSSKILTSAIKQLGVSAYELVRLAQVGLFPSGKAGIAPFHDLEDQVSPEIRAKIALIEKQLNDGKLKTGVPESKP
jgi:basic membrane protein A